jgi:hypothetical protein
MTLPSLSFIVWSGSRFLGAFVGDLQPELDQARGFAREYQIAGLLRQIVS